MVAAIPSSFFYHRERGVEAPRLRLVHNPDEPPLRMTRLKVLFLPSALFAAAVAHLCLLHFRQLAGHAVEHSVDEGHRFRRGEPPRNFQRLVDHYRARGLRKAQELSHSRAQQVPVHRRHSFHPPALRVALDNLIDLRSPFAGNAEQLVGKGANIFVQVFTLAPERASHLVPVLLCYVQLEEHLQRQFARLPAAGRLAHRLPPAMFDVGFTTLSRRHAISTAVRPASNPLLPAFSPARSMACSSVSQVSTPKACGTPVSCADWPTPRVTSLAMTS